MSRALLAGLPAVHELVRASTAPDGPPGWAILDAARRTIAKHKAAILRGTAMPAPIDPLEVRTLAAELARASLRRIINATGVVLHTNLGRAPLADAAAEAIRDVARGYSNLEYDLGKGERGSRHDHLRDLLCTLTGAEDGIVVNNNAAATVLGLAALATDREIIVSRGELIEIGGSFRLPEILALSRGILVEVGTTNKTHAKDYARAITERTGLLLKVHRSNFAIVGFTAEVTVEELVTIGGRIPTMVDLGSGALVSREQQRAWGLPDEPTVREVVASGADLVTFSGDKLLGGPQAGILVGKHAAVERARTHPLMRALRPDKLAIAGLAATLALYRDAAFDQIPTLAMLGRPAAAVREDARRLADGLGTLAGVTVAVEPCTSTVGGGAMPTAAIPSFAVTLAGDVSAIEAALRRANIVARVAADRVWLDVRTVAPDEHGAIIDALVGL